MFFFQNMCKCMRAPWTQVSLIDFFFSFWLSFCTWFRPCQPFVLYHCISPNDGSKNKVVKMLFALAGNWNSKLKKKQIENKLRLSKASSQTLNSSNNNFWSLDCLCLVNASLDSTPYQIFINILISLIIFLIKNMSTNFISTRSCSKRWYI